MVLTRPIAWLFWPVHALALALERAACMVLVVCEFPFEGEGWYEKKMSQDDRTKKPHEALDKRDARLYAAELDARAAELGLFNPETLARDIPEEIVTLTEKDYKGDDPTRCNAHVDGARFCARRAGHDGDFHLDGWGRGWRVME